MLWGRPAPEVPVGFRILCF